MNCEHFHLYFRTLDQTFNFDFLEEKTASGRIYLIRGESSQILWLQSRIPELNIGSRISKQEIKDQLIKLNVEGLEVSTIAKTHSVASFISPSLDWIEDEIKMKRVVAEKYWEEKRSDPSELIDFIRQCGESPQTFLEALQLSDRERFIQLFEKLPMGQVRVINQGEGLNAIPPTPPIDPMKQSVTESEIDALQRYMNGIRFSGVVCLSDRTKTYILKSENIKDPETPFAIHSVGKFFTGILTLKMIQAGILLEKDLDQPIQLDPLELEKLPPQIKIHLTGHKAPTFKQIMQHQGGLGDYLGKYLKELKEMIQSGGTIIGMRTPEDLLKYADGDIFDLKPSESRYSNLGILLVGLSIQYRYNQAYGSKKEYQDILNEFIIKPAKLESFSIGKPQNGCFNENDAVAPYISGGPAGGYWISGKDLLTFGEWIAEECKDVHFKSLVDLHGGEFSPLFGELSHGGQIDSSGAFLGCFLPNGITISILSNRPSQAAVLESAIRSHILVNKKGGKTLQGLLPRLSPPSEVQKPMNLLEKMKIYNVPGVRVAVINDFKVEWSQGFGNLENKDLRIQAASISKSIASLAVHSLIREGRLDYVLDVREVLGEKLWQEIDPENITDGGKFPVTIKTLLSHTAGITLRGEFSGFPGYQKEESVSEIEKYPSTEQILKGRSAENPHVNSEPIRVTRRPDPNPENFHYQGGGYIILQKVIETITGKSFSTYVQENVFNPLGMQRSTYAIEGFPRSFGYSGKGELIPGGYHIYPELAAAGAWSTPEDLAKLMIEIQQAYRGKSCKILNRELAKNMLTPLMGLGVAVPAIEGARYFFHEGGNAGFSCLMIGNTKGQGAVIMTNSDNGRSLIDELLSRIATVYGWEHSEKLERLEPLMDFEEASKIDPEEWFKAATGEYQLSPEKSLDITLKIFRNEKKVMGRVAGEGVDQTFEIFPVSKSRGCLRLYNNSPYIPIDLDQNHISFFGERFIPK